MFIKTVDNEREYSYKLITINYNNFGYELGVCITKVISLGEMATLCLLDNYFFWSNISKRVGLTSIRQQPNYTEQQETFFLVCFK